MQAALGELRAALGRPISAHARPSRTTLGELVDRRAERTPELVVSWPEPVRVPEHLESLAQSVFLEALRNCDKHARARRIEVRVAAPDDAFELEITNDGSSGTRRRRGPRIAAAVARGPAAGRAGRVRSAAAGPLARAHGRLGDRGVSAGGGRERELSLRVLVVDDHDVVHWGFRLLLERQPWVERCAAASNATEALELAAELRPDVALVDLFLGGESGAELTEELKARSPRTRVLLISGAGTVSRAVATAAGASGFVSKDWGAPDVVKAVRMVALGMEVFEPQREPARPALTAREREVLEEIATGATNREIGEHLYLSPHTVKEHTSAIYRKLEVRNRAEAVQHAQRLGLIGVGARSRGSQVAIRRDRPPGRPRGSPRAGGRRTETLNGGTFAGKYRRMHTALLFPGQGSQTPDMRELADRHEPELVELAIDEVGADPFALAGEGTAYAQPAILCASLAAWTAAGRPLAPVHAGHSLGELSALAAAGSIAPDDAVRLAVLRGRLMQEAVGDAPGGMMALLGDGDEARAAAAATGVAIANDNAPTQVVVAGPREALGETAAEAKRRGVRAIELAVRGAFHTPAVDSAVAPFRTALGRVAIEPPAVPVFSSSTAQPFGARADGIRDQLAAALVRPVRWRETLEELRALGVRCFIETGPGNALSAIVRRAYSDVEASLLARGWPAHA